MAEFQEVMRQYGRMCTAHAGCIDCPLKPDGVSDRCNLGAFVNDSECIEREIMKWAAEHPEPVYPSWLEWLTEKGIVFYKPVSETLSFATIYAPLAVTPIPADIAEKLGRVLTRTV